jgi:formiminotetrahydrofolate cyclodeaminase
MTSIASHPFGQLLEAVAAKSPTPGGGAVACAAAALAASLAGMVVAYSVAKKDLAEHQPALLEAQAYLARARAMFLELGDEDAAAYGLLNALQKLPETDPRRAAELPAAALACVQVPLSSVAACADVLRLLETLAPITNKHLRSDLYVAAILADAGARGGACNVRVNLPLLTQQDRAASEATLRTLLEHCAACAARLQE